jgi:Domain of unknown function (DUF4407)
MTSQTVWRAISLTHFFQYLSKTDQDAISSPACSASARMTQTMLGVMVFITGVFAFLSAAFAINTAFNSVPLAVLVGVLWGLMIIWFDRAIVSSANKSTIMIRLPIALIIGFSVSIPLELKILEGRLEKFLTDKSKIENKDVLDRRNTQIASFQNQKKVLEDAEAKYGDNVAKWSDAMEAEARGREREGQPRPAGRGPIWDEARMNKATNEKLLQDTTERLNALKEKESTELQRIDDELKNPMVGFTQQDYTFLSKFEALEDLKQESAPARELSWLLRLLFVFVEMFPALLKLFLPYSSYDALLESHRRESVQLVHSIANERMTRMASKPSAVHGSLLNAVSIATNGVQSGQQMAVPSNPPVP